MDVLLCEMIGKNTGPANVNEHSNMAVRRAKLTFDLCHVMYRFLRRHYKLVFRAFLGALPVVSTCANRHSEHTYMSFPAGFLGTFS